MYTVYLDTCGYLPHEKIYAGVVGDGMAGDGLVGNCMVGDAMVNGLEIPT